MRPKRPSTTLTASAVGLALAAVLALPAPARAGDDDKTIDAKIIGGVLEGLGLRRDDGNTINYEERAPLVIPPSRDLPPPENVDATVANNPAWPKDPDVARRKAEAALLRNRNVEAERVREEGRLSADELAPGAKANPREAYRRSPGEASPGPEQDRLSPKELGNKTSVFSNMFSSKDEADNGRFVGEPPRASLTDPPRGYQVPSPDQPYGLGKEVVVPKATDYLATHGEMSGATSR